MVAPDASLSNYRFRGASFGVVYNCSVPSVGCGFTVTRDGATVSGPHAFGTTVDCRTAGRCAPRVDGCVRLG